MGNVYFGNDGADEDSSENVYPIRKDDQRLINISGIEPILIGSYTIESLCNPNKIAKDTRNNVYVGAYYGLHFILN